MKDLCSSADNCFKGKDRALAYADKLMYMLPVTRGPKRVDENWRPDPRDYFEPVNDLPVHKATGQQIFLPVAESRVFTRADAAKAFGEKFLPADKRIPNPTSIIKRKEY